MDDYEKSRWNLEDFPGLDALIQAVLPRLKVGLRSLLASMRLDSLPLARRLATLKQPEAQEDPERMRTARHEAGHALVAYLLGVSMSEAQLTARTELSEALDGSPAELGKVSYEDGAMPGDEEDSSILIHLSGLAATGLEEEGSESQAEIAASLEARAFYDWSDLANPYIGLRMRVTAVESDGSARCVRITPEVKARARRQDARAREIFFALLGDLNHLFQRPDFTKSLDLVQNGLLQGKLDGSPNEWIKQTLLANGISMRDISAMKAALEDVDFRGV